MSGAVKEALGRRLRAVLGRFGYELHRAGDGRESFPADYDEDAVDLYRSVRPFTLTSHERVVALRDAVRYVVHAEVPGAIVECGVWNGGSMLAAVKTLLACGVSDRDLYLYDTFESMPPPGPEDFFASGQWAGEVYQDFIDNPFYANHPLERVRDLLRSTGYPESRLHFVKGMVEETIPGIAPETIALLRLDTDLYESTRHELVELFPRVTEGGVLIVDDYGDFLGARKAVDEYFGSRGIAPLLQRVDTTARLLVVTAEAARRARAAPPPVPEP